jgi:hypothetical protein
VPATEGRGDPPASRLVVWGSLLALALLAAAGLALGVLVIQLAIHWASR